MIFLNGNKAYELFEKYQNKYTNLKIVKLPSTSSANARFDFEMLCEEWKKIKNSK